MQSRSDSRNLQNGTHSGGYALSPALYNSIGHGQLQYCLPGGPYGPMQKEEMTTAFNNLNVTYGVGPAASNSGAYWVPGMNTVQNNGGIQYRLRDGRFLPAHAGTSQPGYQTSNEALAYPQAHYLPQGFQYSNGNSMSGANAMGWSGAQQFSRETPVPELAAPRRNSLSSNEENGPHTPFFAPGARSDFHPKVAFADSPQAWTTPSPHQLVPSFMPEPLVKSPNGQYLRMDLDAICMQDPSIPKPVPAIFSGEKGRGTLEKSLQNNLNTTNVYIRGLHPNTTDDMLKSYGERFGEIVSAKSMLDQETGNCKGFGFIKYHNFVDGENCIRAFFHWGYEAKWARVSHNEKLKTLGDENNTNLYVSNLPLDFNEHTLMATFQEFEVLSAKILRDANGLSRGVGFARFGSPEICRKIIENYNGQKIGDEGSTLSIRFADTPKQKELKTITAERRNYKAAEYNTAVYSPGSPYLTASSITTTVPSPLASRASIASSNFWPSNVQHNGLPYSTYPLSTGAYRSPVLPSLSAYKISGTENVAPDSQQGDRGKLDTTDNNPDSPTTAVLTRESSHVNVQSPVKSEGDRSVGKCFGSGASDAKSSPIKPTKYSPIKTTPSKINLLRL